MGSSKNTAKQSIQTLLIQAQANLKTNPKRSKRYIEMLWALVKKNKVRPDNLQKQKFCRKCLNLFEIGKNAVVIFNSKNNSFYIKCKKCESKVKLSLK